MKDDVAMGPLAAARIVERTAEIARERQTRILGFMWDGGRFDPAITRHALQIIGEHAIVTVEFSWRSMRQFLDGQIRSITEGRLAFAVDQLGKRQAEDDMETSVGRS
ncbi:MAG: hypothetical protein JNL33_17670 [Betaproteobacteria bacterium]|nr:hypothetical protein [Betaproteobacteria bacterium]MBL8535684.1 hypothetical protein [Betaproteobacteria bacterium]